MGVAAQVYINPSTYLHLPSREDLLCQGERDTCNTVLSPRLQLNPAGREKGRWETREINVHNLILAHASFWGVERTPAVCFTRQNYTILLVLGENKLYSGGISLPLLGQSSQKLVLKKRKYL